MARIESAGPTSLDQDVGSHYVLGDSVTVLYAGAAVFAGQFGAWTPIGGELIANVYKLVWKYGGTNDYVIWDVDVAGNYLSQSGPLTSASSTLRVLEPGFNQDLNSSGGIETSVAIDPAGSTRLSNVADSYVLSPAGSSLGPTLKYGSSAVATGQFGAWAPLGAEWIAGVYKIVWRSGSADYYVVWDVDSSGNWLSQSAQVSGSSAMIRSLEAVFNQDFNSSGSVETGTIVEAVGLTALTRVGGGYVLSPSGSTLGPQLKYGGALVMTDQFSGWTPVGAEQTSAGYQVVWQDTSNRFIVWNVDGSGNWLSQSAALATDSLDVQLLEVGFGQNFNGGGTLPRADIEALGSTALATIGGSYYGLSPSGDTVGPQLRYGGALVTVGQFGAWTPLGAEAFAGGYVVVWKNGSADQYVTWMVDGSGNWLSQSAIVAGSSVVIQSLEPGFDQDLGGGGIASRDVVEGAGSTTLASIAGTNYVLSSTGSALGQVLKYGGAAVTSGQFGSWTPVAAEWWGGMYRMVWKSGALDQFVAWNVDAAGNYVSQGTVVAGTSIWAQSYETVVQFDFNGDTVVGATATRIESSGGTTLSKVADSYFFNYGSAPIQLQYGGTYAAEGQFGLWTPLAVEMSGGVYRLAWKFGSADYYVAWNVDAGGNYISQGPVAGGSTWWVQSEEWVVQFDLNGDGLVGPVTASIESFGASTLTKVADSYFINFNATNVQLKYGGTYAAAGQFGAWTPIGAEQTVGGHIVAWKNGSADQYVIWSTDANGNYMWQNGSNISGSSTLMQALEAAFQQDLSGGGPTASRVVIESAGSTTLTNVGGYLLLDAAGALSGPLLAFGDQYATSFQGGGAVIGAEWTGNGYVVAWNTGTDRFNFWNTDVSGRYSSQTGNLLGTSVQMQAFETTFQQDLNADGVIGVNTSPFNIQVVYTGNSAYQSYFTQAALRWESVIKTDLVGMNHYAYGFIDDLRIEATVRFIDGTNGVLGRAGPDSDALRPGSNLPYHGIMEFDSADLATMASNGTLLNVIIHEMGHVLGLGTLWGRMGLTSGASYLGTNALNAYWQVGGTGSSVPLETGGGSGTAFAHWSEAVFDNELMTGYVENPGVSMPLSIVTIGSLQDLGYNVDYSAANPYRLPGHLMADAGSGEAQAPSSVTSEATPPASDDPLGTDDALEWQSITIEDHGGSSLVQDIDHYFLVDTAGDAWAPPLSYAGVAVTAGEFGGWTPIGAEHTASGYQIAWKMADADEYIVWQTDSAGQWLSQTAPISGASSVLQSLERGFGQDLNGDGVTGLHSVAIESQGQTSLFRVADGYSLQATTAASGPQLKYEGAAVTAGQFGGWEPIAAEQTSGGFRVAWKMDGADQFIVWRVDGNGDWVSQTAVMSGNSPELKAFESALAQDLDGDGQVGAPAGGAVAAASADHPSDWMVH